MMKKQPKKRSKFSKIYVVSFVVSLFCVYINILSNSDFYANEYSVRDSSVWCKDSSINSKVCKFKYVCYDPDLMSVLFFLGNLSVIKGLSNYKEFQTIQLSSVSLHNKFEANISVVDKNHKIFNFDYIKKALLFSRFKPDNIMHAIHDDLIPLFLTLEDICLGNSKCQQNYKIIIHDSYPQGLFHDLYVIFSSFQPIMLNNVTKVLCFEELRMGLLKDSVVYDYGFDKPQGPVQNIKLHSNDLLRFTSYVRSKLKIKLDDVNNSIVLVSRKKTRKIMNENNVIHMLESVYKSKAMKNVQVVCLDLYENDIYSFIKQVSQASALVGMHGAEMIFSIFLKPNSTVVELFPYGIKPHVSFIKPLTNVKGIHFNYFHWENRNRNNSLFHPNADPLHGGINHLPTDIQIDIKNVKEVPPVYCCNNPLYLYYVYQDTLIDSRFKSFLIEKLYGTERKNFKFGSEWFYPSTVTHIDCRYNSAKSFINISWSAPFNVRNDQVFYDIFLLSKNIKKNVITKDTSLVINVTQNEPNMKIQTWITSVIKSTKTRSKDILIECTIS